MSVKAQIHLGAITEGMNMSCMVMDKCFVFVLCTLCNTFVIVQSSVDRCKVVWLEKILKEPECSRLRLRVQELGFPLHP